MIIKYLKQLPLAYLALLFCFFSLTVLCSVIKLDTSSSNFLSAVKTFKLEGTYPSFGLPWRKIVLDNYTEAIMINTAYFTNSDKPIESALTNKRYAGAENPINQIENLEKMSKGLQGKEYGYERYWHGYLVYLRPFMAIISYSFLRIVLSFVLYGLFVLFIFLLWKKFGLKSAIIFVFSFFIVDFFYIGISMQFSNVFIVALSTTIYALTRKNKSHNDDYLIFFISGALTSFFDLLTAPIVSLGLLLTIDNLRKDSHLKSVFINVFFWFVGYMGLWASKWILSSIFYAPQALLVAFDQIINRTVNKADEKFSHLEAVRLNIFQLIGYSRESKIFFVCLFAIMLFTFLRYKAIKKANFRKVSLWITIGSIPYIWYLIAANHSYLHVWFTYRAQLMSVIAGLFIYAEFIDYKKINSDFAAIIKVFLSFFPTSNDGRNRTKEI